MSEKAVSEKAASQPMPDVPCRRLLREQSAHPVRCDHVSLGYAEDEEHDAEHHWSRSSQAEAAANYVRLRNEVLDLFNPSDGDCDEGYILACAMRNAVAFIEAQPCGCTPERIDDYDACKRCDALGRLGDKQVDR